MILSESHLTWDNASTHFFANNILAPTMPLSFPTQNILYLESFTSANLAGVPPYITSYKPHECQLYTWTLL